MSKIELNIESLSNVGAHFGHPSSKWHPNFEKFISSKKNGIHIIDLVQTEKYLVKATKELSKIINKGGNVLFVGTKKQAQEAIRGEANRCEMPYMNQRWLGGTLTNFSTIRGRANYMIELETQKSAGHWDVLLKKEALKLEEQLRKLQKYLAGIRDMKQLPTALFVVDICKEAICVAEARKLGIKLISIIDSDCDPFLIDHYIPGNDDAIRSIKLITTRIADGVIQGSREREALLNEQQESDAAEYGLNGEEDPELLEAVPSGS